MQPLFSFYCEIQRISTTKGFLRFCGNLDKMKIYWTGCTHMIILKVILLMLIYAMFWVNIWHLNIFLDRYFNTSNQTDNKIPYFCIQRLQTWTEKNSNIKALKSFKFSPTLSIFLLVLTFHCWDWGRILNSKVLSAK